MNEPTEAEFKELYESTREEDQRWFKAHPGRRFHLRDATQYERDCGFADADDLVVVALLPDRLFKLASRHKDDLPECDNDARGKELFACFLDGFGKGDGPAIMAVDKKMRKVLGLRPRTSRDPQEYWHRRDLEAWMRSQEALYGPDWRFKVAAE